MDLEKIDKNIYEFPQKTLFSRIYGRIEKFEMEVPVRIFASEEILNWIFQDRTLEQMSNVACLRGTEKYVIVLPDAHQGYGFCIGGVAGTDGESGLLTPGGVGYDINCGVRLLSTNLFEKDIRNELPELLDLIYKNIPSGLGSEGRLNINNSDLKSILNTGLEWCLEKGFATKDDLVLCEEEGKLEEAKAELVSKKAKDRGINQVGSLGSGNHFIEIQKVKEIYNPEIAKKLNIQDLNQIMTMIHTGSRALGHQVCTDSLRKIEKSMKKYNIKVPDRELASVPANTREGEDYQSQMACAANFGFCNRQLITYWIRESFEKGFKSSRIQLVYDLCHNILKKEEHKVAGQKKFLNIHRKGATRAFPAGHPKIPSKYRPIGQPVIIPGTMGSASYLCIGKPESMELTFGSTTHGSGRLISRAKAKKKYWGNQVRKNLYKNGIMVKSKNMRIIAEEAPDAYKDIHEVVQISHDLGIIEKIAKLVPLGVIKG
ncbi:MAG: tRNA-splicing ligase RtcB [Promethearchaeota archaeon]|nr:MAG: tRNA-splicing ligase RtcB [Candidatus Lokiarchaeota archaeon]